MHFDQLFVFIDGFCVKFREVKYSEYIQLICGYKIRILPYLNLLFKIPDRVSDTLLFCAIFMNEFFDIE